jgi:hypothetical protein
MKTAAADFSLDPKLGPAARPMIFAIISIAWLSIASLVVVACRMAAHGDREIAAVNPVRERVVVHQRARWQDVPHHPGAARVSTGSVRPARRARVRGTSCAAGS